MKSKLRAAIFSALLGVNSVFSFLKRASQRTAKEKIHIDSVLENNDRFAKLEIIKERMLTFFLEKRRAVS